MRAISRVLEQDWAQTYIDLCLYGLVSCDMPSSNAVWGKYLRAHGFRRRLASDACEVTVERFAAEHPDGVFLLALNGHVVACVDGDWFDTWDSAAECVIYYWEKEA